MCSGSFKHSNTRSPSLFRGLGEDTGFRGSSISNVSIHSITDGTRWFGIYSVIRNPRTSECSACFVCSASFNHFGSRTISIPVDSHTVSLFRILSGTRVQYGASKYHPRVAVIGRTNNCRRIPRSNHTPWFHNCYSNYSGETRRKRQLARARQPVFQGLLRERVR